MPTTFQLEEARDRWRRLAAEDAGVAPIARFHVARLERLAQGLAPAVTLRLTPEEATRAVAAGEPLLTAGVVELDVGEVERELRATAEALRDVASGPAARAARAVETSPVDLTDALAALLRGDDPSFEAKAFALDLPVDTLRPLCELAIQPTLWACAEQSATLTDLARWQRGYCPICGAWPLYGELVGAQRERKLRCGRCGASWSWAVLLCPYCGNDDHRALGQLGSAEERESKRVDLCERCRGYLKGIASFTPVSAPQLAAEDAATLHLDVAAEGRGYARPGRPPDAAYAGVPPAARGAGGAGPGSPDLSR